MMSLEHRFLFLHVPKSGGNSIQSVLVDYSDDEIVTRNDAQDGFQRFAIRNPVLGVAKHATLRNYVDAFGTDVCAGLYRFATLRNPWDRAMSYYFSPHFGHQDWHRERFMDLVNKMPTLREFVAVEASNKSRLDADIDRLIRFEHLAVDFQKVCQDLGLPELSLPRRNASGKAHYTEHYDEELVALVACRFAEEVEFGGYEFG